MTTHNRRNSDEKITEMEHVFEQRQAEMKSDIEEIKKDMASLKTDIGELLSIFKAFKGTARVAGWIGNGVKWIIGIGIAVGGVIAMIKGMPK